MSLPTDNDGIIYALSNPAMPGLVKIGMTTRDQVDNRMNELYSTGVPVPFECEFAGRINDISKVEKALHIAFGPYRINPRREFFEIDPIQVVELIRLFCHEDVTPQVNAELSDEIDQASKQAGRKLKASRRPPFKFSEMGIPLGSVLSSNVNDDECLVVEDKKVRFQDRVLSLTKATRLSLDNSYNVAPCPHWVFDGTNLRDLYDATYGSADED